VYLNRETVQASATLNAQSAAFLLKQIVGRFESNAEAAACSWRTPRTRLHPRYAVRMRTCAATDEEPVGRRSVSFV